MQDPNFTQGLKLVNRNIWTESDKIMHTTHEMCFTLKSNLFSRFPSKGVFCNIIKYFSVADILD